MNLVNELQVSAEENDVLTVLRKTKRLASKLGRQDIAEWLQAEQSGYAVEQNVPEYRKVGTTLAYKTNGYIPAGFGMLMNGAEELPSSGLTTPMSVRESISAVLSWIEKENASSGLYFSIPPSNDYDRALRSIIRFNPMFSHQITLMLRLNDAQIKAIPEQIKDKVLDWACALEAAGVTGEGMSFSAKEKEAAQSIVINIYDSQIEQLTNSGVNQKGSK